MLWQIGGLVAVLCLALSAQGQEQAQPSSLWQIRIVDKRTTQPIQFVHLSAPQASQLTDSLGVARLPRRLIGPTTPLQASCMGYYSARFTLAQLGEVGGVYTLALEQDSRTLSTVVVEGARRIVSTNVVSQKVSQDQLERSLGSSLAQVLSHVSGVSMIQSGTTVAKPVIHGMYGNRILILSNGVRLSGQQWGDDHAPEIDIEQSGAVDVVKGAEAVRYGSEAIGGAILLGQAPLPYLDTHVHGSLGTLYATNGRRTSSVVKLEGALPCYSNVAWRAQASYTNGGDRSTANYLLWNTGVRNLSYSLALGWNLGNLRTEAFYSHYRDKSGLLLAGHLRNRDEMQDLIDIGRPEYFRPFSRGIGYPYHQVDHKLWTLKAQYHDDQLGNFVLQASYQQDERNEYSLRRNRRSHIPTMSLILNSQQLRLQWNKTIATRWYSEAGLHWERTNSRSLAGTGVVPIIPNYTDLTVGVHLLERYEAGRWGVEAGLRLDRILMSAAGYDQYQEYYSGDHRNTNLTYSLSGHYQLGRGWKVISNFGVAWRAPHVYELYSDGNQHGGAIYMIGNRELRSERGYKWISSLSHSGKRLTLQLDAYLQWIVGYIYDEPTHDFRVTLSGEYPIFRYKQSNAFFRGIDLTASYTLLPRLSYHLSGSMIWANELGSRQFFPYIPPLRLSQSLSWSPRVGSSQLELSLSHRFVDRQHRFDAQTDLTVSPPAYQLWGIEAGWTMELKNGNRLRLLLDVDNLFNREYKEYTNRARYYSHDAGRDIRLSLHWTF